MIHTLGQNIHMIHKYKHSHDPQVENLHNRDTWPSRTLETFTCVTQVDTGDSNILILSGLFPYKGTRLTQRRRRIPLCREIAPAVSHLVVVQLCCSPAGCAGRTLCARTGATPSSPSCSICQNQPPGGSTHQTCFGMNIWVWWYHCLLS